MSVVTNIVARDFTCVSYDGRATDKDGAIASENIEKALRINRFTCVGATGILETAQDVFRILKGNVVGISEMRCDTVALAICRILKLPGAPKLYGSFLTTGLDSEGRISSYTIGKELVPTPYIPIGGEYRLACLCSERNTLDFVDFFLHNQRLGKPHLIAEAYIREVAKIDPTVNSNARSIIMTRQELLRL